MSERLWNRLESLRLEIDGYSLEPLSIDTHSGWTRHTTAVALHGGGMRGVGEDVTYEADEQQTFQRRDAELDLAGRFTLAELSSRLDECDLFPEGTGRDENRHYRRWAFESAALDLALRQSGKGLGAVLERSCRPVTFVASLGLGEPPTLEPLERLIERVPSLRFKIDYAASWTEQTAELLAGIADRIAVVDFKAHYHGSFEGPQSDAKVCAAVARALPQAWLEDTAWDGPAWDAFESHRRRITWDAVLHALSDFDRLPLEPRCVNIKPSRFGRISELMAVYDHCEDRGIAMYGGGQFELGPGRSQIQHLASLFHADAANDVAPVTYHLGPRAPELPASPLPAEIVRAFGH